MPASSCGRGEFVHADVHHSRACARRTVHARADVHADDRLRLIDVAGGDPAA
jgi:hypothetical protein